MVSLGASAPHVGIVGGGIVGLATARALLARSDPPVVTVLEKEASVGRHQTTRNSGVLHAGIYYPPGSLKAKLCRRGAVLMAQYCQARGLPYKQCGKLIIALRDDELPRLEALLDKGTANGVPGLRWVEAAEIPYIEPAATGIAALHSPETAIVDFAAVAGSLAQDVERAGGVVRTNAQVDGILRDANRIRVASGEESWSFDYLVCCAGAQADRLAAMTGHGDGPRIVPFKGRYLRLRPGRRELIRGLIYPVPDPRYPFLGVHLTRRIDGEVLIGPNAFLAVGREAGNGLRAQLADAFSTARWPGFWRLLPGHVGTGASELSRTLSRRRFTREARRYVPDLALADTVPGPFGIRAQAVHADGRLEDDFLVSTSDQVLHVRNAPSPAATSSLALAEVIARAVPDSVGASIQPIVA